MTMIWGLLVLRMSRPSPPLPADDESDVTLLNAVGLNGFVDRFHHFLDGHGDDESNGGGKFVESVDVFPEQKTLPP